ncbi:MAG: GAF domain-containing sensor histidine kinase [Candidatus Thermoplasmatota archaeon]|nr:GAF domain-containing sensor histidine kinase [Candidatus Thermoplasmatota archaeon]
MTRNHIPDEESQHEQGPPPDTHGPAEGELVILRRELNIRTEIGRVVSSYSRPTELLPNILSILCQGFGAPGGAIYFMDRATNEIELKATFGLDRNYAVNYQKIHLGQNVTGRVAETGEGMIIKDSAMDERSTKGVVEMLKYRSAVVTPVVSGRELIGIIALVSDIPNYFTEKDLKLLDHIGEHISPAVVNSLLNQRIDMEREKTMDILERLDEGIFEAELKVPINVASDTETAVQEFLDGAYFTLMNRSFSDQCDKGIWLGADIRSGFDERQIRRMLDEVIAKGEVKAIERKWSGERERVFEVSMVRVDKDSLFKGVRGIRRDVTGRSIMEDRVRRSKSETEFYMDLLSHDISNINTSVLGFLEMMESGVNRSNATQRFINIVRNEIRRSSNMVHKVKVLARVQKEAPVLKRTDVSKGIVTNFDVIKRQYPDRTLILEHDPGLSPVRITCDDLFDELVKNIFQFEIEGTKDEKVVLKVDLRKWEFDEKKGYLLSFFNEAFDISVANRGHVMTRSLTEDGEPHVVSLSLNVVKAITERYNGRLWFEDQVPGGRKGGTTIMVFLPS